MRNFILKSTLFILIFISTFVGIEFFYSKDANAGVCSIYYSGGFNDPYWVQCGGRRVSQTADPFYGYGINLAGEYGDRVVWEYGKRGASYEYAYYANSVSFGNSNNFKIETHRAYWINYTNVDAVYPSGGNGNRLQWFFRRTISGTPTEGGYFAVCLDKGGGSRDAWPVPTESYNVRRDFVTQVTQVTKAGSGKFISGFNVGVSGASWFYGGKAYSVDPIYNVGACPEQCWIGYSDVCSNSDLYIQNKCTGELTFKQDCGEDSYGAWGANFCGGDGNVYHSRTFYDRGCSGSACFENGSVQTELAGTCSFGCSSGVCLTNQPPIAQFSFSSRTSPPGAGQDIQFTDGSSDPDGNIASWFWDFGDGITSVSQNPAHSYASARTYQAVLTAIDNQGASNSISQNIAVIDCDSSFPQSKFRVCVYDGINFDQGFLASFSQNTISSPAPTSFTAIDYNWGAGGPDVFGNPPQETETFSIRWRGNVNFLSGYYRFQTISDDGVRLFVDINKNSIFESGEEIISNWTDHPIATDTSSWVNLSGATNILLEFYENGGDAIIQMNWEKGDIPSPFNNLTASAITCNAINLQWQDTSGEDGYFVFRNGIKIDSLPANQNYYTDLVAESTSYNYFIRAYNQSGSTDSNNANASTPSCLASAPKLRADGYCPNVVSLSWDEPSLGTPFGYSIYRQDPGSPSFNLITIGDCASLIDVNRTGCQDLVPISLSMEEFIYYITVYDKVSGEGPASVQVSIKPCFTPRWREIIPR